MVVLSIWWFLNGVANGPGWISIARILKAVGFQVPTLKYHQERILREKVTNTYWYLQKFYRNLSPFKNLFMFNGKKNKRTFLKTTHNASWLNVTFFSSSELEAQVSFSNCLLAVCLSFCKLFTFSTSSPKPLGQVLPNLAQSILGKGDSSLFKWRTTPFFKGR